MSTPILMEPTHKMQERSILITSSIGYLRTDWVADPFKGSIEDVRIYDYALSQSEITALAASPPAACNFNITGTVYEDVNGDADMADQVARDNVTVAYYLDGGDGQPDGVDDGSATTTTTDGSGNYSFSGLSAGTDRATKCSPGFGLAL